MSEHHDKTLSRAGDRRREAMLEELLGVMAHTRCARRLRGGTVAATGAMFAILLAVWLAAPSARIGHDVHSSPIAANDVRGDSGSGAPAHAKAGGPKVLRDNVVPEVPESPAVVTRLVRTDPSIVDRYRARPLGSTVRLNDDALIDTLAAIHRPAGVIRFGDRVALSAPVTDAQLGLDH